MDKIEPHWNKDHTKYTILISTGWKVLTDSPTFDIMVTSGENQ